MSSEANIQIVQKAYNDFGAGDIPAILAILDDNVEWTTPGDTPESGTWVGQANVLKFFQAVGATWNFSAFNPREFVASGDKVVAIGDYTATVRSTGREVASEWVMVWTFRDGKVTAFREYTDTLAVHNGMQAAAPAAA